MPVQSCALLARRDRYRASRRWELSRRFEGAQAGEG
jgi:hypothetical protein